jgi:hypothetical protein
MYNAAKQPNSSDGQHPYKFWNRKNAKMLRTLLQKFMLEKRSNFFYLNKRCETGDV